MFFAILIFDPKSGFFKGYRLCIMAGLNALICRIFGVFSNGFFAHKNSQ